MFVSQERIETEHILDDLRDRVHLHMDVLASYDDALQQLRAERLRRLFRSARTEHAAAVDELANLIGHYGGQVDCRLDWAGAGTRLRVVFGRLLSDSGTVRAMIRSEAKLVREYGRDINSLAYLPGVESQLEKHRIEAHRRLQRLEQAIGLD